MMKEIPFNFKEYNDGYVLYMIYQEYERYNSVDICELWRQKYFLDFDDEIDEYNNHMILSLIKNMHLIFMILINMILMILMMKLILIIIFMIII